MALVELSQNSRPNFKVNGHRLKHYFGGDIPTEVVPDLQTFPMDQKIRGIGSSVATLNKRFVGGTPCLLVVDFPDCEDSRARNFTLHPQEFHILNFILGIHKAIVSKVIRACPTQQVSSDVAELKDMVRALILDKKNQTPAPVKAVEQSCVTCGGGHSYQNCPATDGNIYRDNIQEYVSQAAAANFNQGNTGYRPQMVANQIRPPGFPPIQSHQGNNQNNFNRGNNYNQNRGNNFNQSQVYRPQVNQPPAYQAPVPQTHGVSKTDFDNYVKANDAVRELLPGNTITNPKEDLKGITTRSGVAYQGPVIPSTLSSSLRKVMNCDTEVPAEKLSEMARTPLNENCSAVILNKLLKKLGDPGRFLIPCEFSGINTCNALADLGASINLMPYSVWKDLSLPELTPTCMTLELADRSITEPIGIAKDVRLMVGKFQFPADFVVVDFEPDPRVPLILGRSFLKTSRALIDVYEGEITLRVGKEAITFNLDQTSRYTANYNHMTANRIDVIELASEEYSQEVLGFSDSVAYGNPSPYYNPIVSNSSPTLTPFGDSDFLLLEEANAFIAIDDEPISREIDATYYDPEGDDKLPVIIAKDLKDEEKAALIKVLKSHKRAIAWKLSDIKGVDPEFCTHKIPLEEGYEHTVQSMGKPDALCTKRVA
ncbi:reverse transcriptase domain-containing protein [Tanacetum coccineum]